MSGSEIIQAGSLSRSDGATIAFDQISGEGPGVIFLHGLKSDRGGTKAAHLMQHCQNRNTPFVTFDMFGHGESSGDFVQGSISHWTGDALAILDELTTGPQILVGSSMGGWVMLNTAVARADRVAGLIGIAAAPDFTEDLMWASLTERQRADFLETGLLALPTSYENEPYDIGIKLVEDGRRTLLLDAPIAFAGPVRLLHGLEDHDVPWQTSIKTAEQLTSDDVTLTLVKDGLHNLSRPQDLDLLTSTLDGLLAQIGDL